MSTVGKWDPELFARYRAATGARRRLLADQLIRENEPLIIVLVDQLCGRGTSARKKKLGGCGGFFAIEFDDAMQAGRLAMAKALDQFDPSKGRIAYYLLQKIRYELQRVETFDLHLARVPRGREGERVGVDLVGESLAMEHLASGDLGGVVDTDLVTPEEVAGWEQSGEWPESLEEHVRSKVPPPPKVLRGPRRPRLSLPQFVSARLRFSRGLRIPRVTLYATFEIETRRSPDGLAQALEEHHVAATKMRVPWAEKPVPAFVGVALTSA